MLYLLSSKIGENEPFIGNLKSNPESKVHGANMGPIWGRQDPGGPHAGPMNFAIWEVYFKKCDDWKYFWDGWWCWLHSTHCDAKWGHRSDSCNGLLPNGTKPLSAPMLIFHQWGYVAFTRRPLPEPMLNYCQVNKLQWNLNQYEFTLKKMYWNVISKMSAMCPGCKCVKWHKMVSVAILVIPYSNKSSYTTFRETESFICSLNNIFSLTYPYISWHPTIPFHLSGTYFGHISAPAMDPRQIFNT